MKNLIALLVAVTISCGICAQTRTAYLDLYQRGGAKHLRTTLTYDNHTVYIGKNNLGEVLNRLAESGWEIDRVMNIRRIAWFFPFTRHKFHIILKKEYTDGENPFDGLASSGTRDYNSYSQTRKDVEAEKSTTYASLEIKRDYNSYSQTGKDIPTEKSTTYDSYEIENDIQGSIIPANAYRYREDITKLAIPESVKSIGMAAFYECSNLKVVIIPENVSKIGQYAFRACKSLELIFCQSATPPDIKLNTFQELPKSAVIYVPEKAVDEYKQAPGWQKYAAQIMPFNY